MVEAFESLQVVACMPLLTTVNWRSPSGNRPKQILWMILSSSLVCIDHAASWYLPYPLLTAPARRQPSCFVVPSPPGRAIAGIPSPDTAPADRVETEDERMLRCSGHVWLDENPFEEG